MEALVVWPRKIPKKMHVKLQMISDSPRMISVYILEIPGKGRKHRAAFNVLGNDALV